MRIDLSNREWPLQDYLSTSISDDYSNHPLFNIQDGQCSMYRPRSIISNIILYAHPVPNSAHLYDYYSLMNVKPLFHIPLSQQ